MRILSRHRALTHPTRLRGTPSRWWPPTLPSKVRVRRLCGCLFVSLCVSASCELCRALCFTAALCSSMIVSSRVRLTSWSLPAAAAVEAGPAQGGQPLFLYLPFIAPHLPTQVATPSSPRLIPSIHLKRQLGGAGAEHGKHSFSSSFLPAPPSHFFLLGEKGFEGVGTN